MTNKPINICDAILRAWFVRHRHYLERTKTFGFCFVFVLAHEQAISKANSNGLFVDGDFFNVLFACKLNWKGRQISKNDGVTCIRDAIFC